MTTPNRSQIYDKAKELYAQHCYRSGTHALADINPTYEELAENGFLAVAQSMLMCSDKASQYGVTAKSENSEIQLDAEEALRTGIYICGTSGSGKSDLGMYVVEELPEDTINVVFDPSQDWLRRSSVPHYTQTQVPYVPQESTIFDLSVYSVRRHQEFIERFCKLLLEQQALGKHKRYFLVFEEGQIAFPEGVLRAKAYENTSKMMSLGRNFGIRFMCITPFSSLIDKKAMRYMKQRYFGYSDEKNDIAYLRSFLEEDAKRLKTLKAGQFLYYDSGKVKRMGIMPYQAETVPTLLEIPQAPLPELQPKIGQQQSLSVVKLVIALLWFAAIVLGLSHMP
jgi:hypothetical protein